MDSSDRQIVLMMVIMWLWVVLIICDFKIYPFLSIFFLIAFLTSLTYLIWRSICFLSERLYPDE